MECKRGLRAALFLLLQILIPAILAYGQFIKVQHQSGSPLAHAEINVLDDPISVKVGEEETARTSEAVLKESATNGIEEATAVKAEEKNHQQKNEEAVEAETNPDRHESRRKDLPRKEESTTNTDREQINDSPRQPPPKDLNAEWAVNDIESSDEAVLLEDDNKRWRTRTRGDVWEENSDDLSGSDSDDEPFNPEEWFLFVQPEEDLQLDMPPELAADFVPYDEQPNFLIPKNLQPAELNAIRWRDTGEIIDDDEVFVVGLPNELTTAFQDYFNDTGLLELAQHLLYSEEESDYDAEEAQLWTIQDGTKWSIKRADHWDTDMVWFDPADEACFERVRQILTERDFEKVMKAISAHLDRPKLTVHGLGAIFVSRFESSPESFHLHRDVPDTRGAFWNILIPVVLPSGEGEEASLYIGGADHLCSPINLVHNVAVVVGSDSWHGTGECNFSEGSFRLSMSIWVSEIDDFTLDVISHDEMSPWPVDKDRLWYTAQSDRDLTNEDRGRAPYDVHDVRSDCELVKDHCETDLWGVRQQCARTCRVYMPTDEYEAYLRFLKNEGASDVSVASQ